MKKGAENEEISIDFETGDEIELETEEVTNAALKDKLKALRAELREAQHERDENLAGWQRSKADLVNFRKTVAEDRERNESRIKGSIIEKLLPALDTFEAAMQEKSWHDVDENWRQGVERIASQFHQALKSEGLERFGAPGEAFDPNVHECMSIVPTEKKKEDHTVAQVFQQGYTINGELVRPAKVVVAQLQDKT